MKVNIDKTIEVSDEQRVAITELRGGEGTATREEVKEFLWTYGASWEAVLGGSDPNQLTLDGLL